jgi:hypothetical protein
MKDLDIDEAILKITLRKYAVGIFINSTTITNPVQTTIPCLSDIHTYIMLPSKLRSNKCSLSLIKYLNECLILDRSPSSDRPNDIG